MSVKVSVEDLSSSDDRVNGVHRLNFQVTTREVSTQAVFEHVRLMNQRRPSNCRMTRNWSEFDRFWRRYKHLLKNPRLKRS